MPQRRTHVLQQAKTTNKNDTSRRSFEEMIHSEARDTTAATRTRTVTFKENVLGPTNPSMPELKIALARQRSFVKTAPTAAKEQPYLLSACSHNENSAVDYQRPFVQPVQMQHQVREAHPHSTRRRNPAMQTNPRGGGKPAMEIYRPPTLRGPGFYDTNEPIYYNGKYAQPPDHYCQNYGYPNQNHSAGTSPSHRAHSHGNPKRSGLNIHAKEFVYGKNGPGSGGQPVSSRGNTGVYQDERIGGGGGLQHSKSGHNLRSGMTNPPKENINLAHSPPALRVHFNDEKENDGHNARPPNLTLAPPFGVKRSKSLGCSDFKEFLHSSTLSQSQMPDIGPFSQEVNNIITKAFIEPSALSGRQLMDVSRHLMTRVLESSRYAEPMARLCIAIIEKEKDETFLESLLNSCQEHFKERDRLLRNSTGASGGPVIPSHPRWIAYMSFLNEMYTQLKRRHVQLMTKRMRNSETAPGLLLLTLLSQCCSVCLKEPSVNSLQETECLFFVLTAIGKDIESELPYMMCRVMSLARDAFINTVKVAPVRKTLLQLIEMHAAGWNMPAPAVMYYYPGSGGK